MMTRLIKAAIVTVVIVMAAQASHVVRAAAGDKGELAGKWTLNTTFSQIPSELGFGMDVLGPGAADDRGETGGGGGRRGGGGGGGSTAAYVPRKESEGEALNVKQLTDEVRTPSRHIVIEQTDTLVSITDEKGRTRRFHPDGRNEFQPLEASPVATTAKWENGALVVHYKVEQDREVKYTYARKQSPSMLVVAVQFVEHNGRGVITLAYAPTSPNEPPPAPPAAAAGSPGAAYPASNLRGAVNAYDPSGRPTLPPTGAAPPPGSMPAVEGMPSEGIGAMKPDAELKGLTKLGVVVEGLDSQAAACGLKQETVEAAMAKSLTDAGLKVSRNGDEDTYLYVNVMTASMATGFCVSRYDATVYTHTTAKMTYGTAPVLVEVSLLRKGGVTGGSTSQHGPAVSTALKQYVDGFAKRIADANK